MQDVFTLKAYMERFEKRTAIIKISKRKLENTEEWDVTISTEEKRAKMRIDGLAEKEEKKVLDERDLFQCEMGTKLSLKIVNVKKRSIQIYLRAAPNAFKSHISFRSSIRAVIQRVLEVGQVDTSIEGTFYVQVTFDTGETREENEEIQRRNRELEETVDRLKEENEEIQRRDRELEETVDQLKENENLHKNRMGELESKMTRLKVENGSNYKNNCMPTVIDIDNTGFFEPALEDQKDSLDKVTVECLNNKVGVPKWKLDLFKNINGYEYEEVDHCCYFGEEEQNNVSLGKNM
ncbi:unnamed protein product [Mytilus coruscus]|uniref:Uncharacterized protein n=1 Tax=Mytilus coruscus TaxID=42192 RepID=A0A6J8AAZ1_MYTCO|nr:unnamed protein product [Mytilus coruscus]